MLNALTTNLQYLQNIITSLKENTTKKQVEEVATSLSIFGLIWVLLFLI